MLLPDHILWLIVKTSFKVWGENDMLSGEHVLHLFNLCATCKKLQEIATAQWNDVECTIDAHMSTSCKSMSTKEACDKFALTQTDILKLAPVGETSSPAAKIQAIIFRSSKSNYQLSDLWNAAIKKHGSYNAVIKVLFLKKRKLTLCDQQKALNYTALKNAAEDHAIPFDFARKQPECQRFLKNKTTFANALDAAVTSWSLVKTLPKLS